MRKLRGQAHWLCQSPQGACPLCGRRAPRPPSATKPANPFWMKSEGGTGRQPLKGAVVPLPLKGLAPLTPIASQ